MGQVEGREGSGWVEREKFIPRALWHKRHPALALGGGRRDSLWQAAVFVPLLQHLEQTDPVVKRQQDLALLHWVSVARCGLCVWGRPAKVPDDDFQRSVHLIRDHRRAGPGFSLKSRFASNKVTRRPPWVDSGDVPEGPSAQCEAQESVTSWAPLCELQRRGLRLRGLRGLRLHGRRLRGLHGLRLCGSRRTP